MWSERLKKYSHKLYWDASALIKPKPNVRTLYQQRSTVYDDDEIGSFVRVCEEPAYIDHKFGHIITENGVWLEDSMHPQITGHKSAWRIDTPSPSKFAEQKKRPVQEYKAVISLRHFWEWNYYHFYMDVLGKLWRFEEVGVPLDIPIVVGKYALEMSFVSQLMNEGHLKKLNWIIQEEENIKAEKIYYCRAIWDFAELCPYLANTIAPDRPNQPENRRVFLTRGPKATRKALNMNEIEPILHKHQFEIVDTDGYSIPQQIDLFANTRYLIALHGAGIANILYRNGFPMSLFEIYSDRLRSDDFEDMCDAMGFDVFEQECPSDPEIDPAWADITIDPVEFEKTLREMLEKGGSL